MFHDVRRKDRAIGREEALAIVADGEWGVLSTADAEGWPYGVPVNHVLVDETLYVHCARRGHKLDNLAANERVCYTVVKTAEVLPAELSTRFESAIVFGRATLVSDEDEKRQALGALLERFAPDHAARGDVESLQSFGRTRVIRVTLEHVTGKARR